MPAGTLVLTNNSDVVPGTGTLFTTELVSGDFIVVTVGGITYTLPVKSIDSNLQITLISKYQGPTQSAIAWYAVPRATQNQVTAALVAQATEALRGQNYDKANWQAVFSDSGDITVLLPDGSTFSGPSWKKIVELLNNIDPDAIQSLADQIHADAEQVGAHRLDVDAKASQVGLDASTASAAATTAVSANTSAEEANAAAQSAKTDAEAARDAAQSANPDNQLKKANNLSDVANTAAARTNISVYSKAEIDAKLDDPYEAGFYLNKTEAAAAGWITWNAALTSTDQELGLHITKNSITVVGRLAAAALAQSAILYTLLKSPKGQTTIRKPAAMVGILGSPASTWVVGYSSPQTSLAGQGFTWIPASNCTAILIDETWYFS